MVPRHHPTVTATDTAASTATSASTVDTVDTVDLQRQVRAVLEQNRTAFGYVAPHATAYPFRWLWDACFHGLVFLAIGDTAAALDELRAALRWQHPDGFVPHVGYPPGHNPHAAFWGRADASTITQPPMTGHLVAELERAGVHVPADLRRRAEAHLAWLLRERRRDDGSVVIVHPWESGCDDSVHWDAWCPGTAWTPQGWFAAKGALVTSLVLDRHGAAVANPAFEVASPGFQALVAFNARELGMDADVALPAASWTPRTVDDLLVALVDPQRVRLRPLLAPDGPFAGRFGPAGVRRDDPRFDGAAYWRGGCWPQMAYLLWVAARRSGAVDVAASLARRTTAGALASGFAEHWHPDTGAPGGARPQSWSGLVAAMR